jgi:tyrosine-protein kinase Etk/Wzc
VYLLQEELQGLRSQLARLQHGVKTRHPLSEAEVQNSQAFFSFDKAPEIKLRYTRLQREAKIQDKLFTLLADQLVRAKIEESRDEMAFQLLDPAIPSKARIKPKRLLSVVLATIVGAFFGAGLAFYFESLDTTVRTREQVELQLGIPLLATVPRLVSPRRSQGQPPEEGLILGDAPGTPALEAFRYLRARLRYQNDGRHLQTVLLTSAGPAEDTTAVLANLAIVAASAGERTLLVDANRRHPTLHSLFHCPLTPGLADILDHTEGWRKGIQPTTVNNLQLIPAGAVAQETFASFDSSAFDILLSRFKEDYDLLLMAAPPVLACSDAAVLGSRVDATCLVLTYGVSRIESIVEARSALEAVQGKVVGAILISG